MQIIIFSAIWCPACLVMKKVWTQIEDANPSIEIIYYDYDLDEDKVEKYQVGTVLPEMIFIKNNEEVKRLKGEKSLKEIKEIIEEIK